MLGLLVVFIVSVIVSATGNVIGVVIIILNVSVTVTDTNTCTSMVYVKC